MKSFRVLILIALAISMMPAFCPAQRVDKKNILVYGGNKIELTDTPVRRTYYLTDDRIPANEAYKREVVVDEYLPVKLNGEKVHERPKEPPRCKKGTFGFGTTILNHIADELAALPDGDFELQMPNLLVDKTGRIVYFDTIYHCDIIYRDHRRVSTTIARPIRQKLIATINEMEVTPAKHYEENVHCVILNPLITTVIVVKNGIVQFK